LRQGPAQQEQGCDPLQANAAPLPPRRRKAQPAKPPVEGAAAAWSSWPRKTCGVACLPASALEAGPSAAAAAAGGSSGNAYDAGG
jgi:hypothetical protein